VGVIISSGKSEAEKKWDFPAKMGAGDTSLEEAVRENGISHTGKRGRQQTAVGTASLPHH
jgi:hypothetical protein